MVNKRQGIISLIVVIVLVAAGFVVVTESNNKGSTNSGTEYVIDAMDRNITTSVTPTRIISTSPALTELVYSLGAQDRLVGVDAYSDYPVDVTDRVNNGSLAVIGGFDGPNCESIVNATGANDSLALVLLDSSVLNDVTLGSQLSSYGINYAFLYGGTNTTEVYENIEILGKVLHESANATNLISTMQNSFANITSSVGTHAIKPTVMFVDYYDLSAPSDLYVAGNQTFINDIITVSGGNNSLANQTGYPVDNIEIAVKTNPDFIIVTSGMSDEGSQEVYDSIMNNTLLISTTAVKDHQVYVLDNQAENCFLRADARDVQAAQILAEILYPSTFNVTIPHILGNDYVNYLP